MSRRSLPLSRQALEESAVSPDDRRAFIAAVSQQLGRLMRHPAPVVPAPPSSARSSVRPAPAKKVHLGILAHNLTALDMSNLRDSVDHRLVHLDFFAKHAGDPTALREPVFHHVSCPETHPIRMVVRAQEDMTAARRCVTARNVSLPAKGNARSKEGHGKGHSKQVDQSSDEDDDRLPRAPRHVQPSRSNPGRLDLNPVPTEDEALQEAWQDDSIVKHTHRYRGPRHECSMCAAVAKETKAIEDRIGLDAAAAKKRNVDGGGSKAKAKKKASRLSTERPHLVREPDLSAMRVIPSTLRFRGVEALVLRLSRPALVELHFAVQSASALQAADSASGAPLSASFASIKDCCRCHLDNIWSAIHGTATSSDDDDRYDVTLTEEDRNRRRQETQQRALRSSQSAAAVSADLSLEAFLSLVQDCVFAEAQPTFRLPYRSRYSTGATRGTSWEDIYGAADVQQTQRVPLLAFLISVSALTRGPDERDVAIEEMALWAILVLLRIDGPLIAPESGQPRPLTSAAVSLAEAFTIRDILSSFAGSHDARMIALTADIQANVADGTPLHAAGLIRSLTTHFLPGGPPSA
jgi:hypothetical protein